MPKRPQPPLLQCASSLADEVFSFSRSAPIERDRGMRDKLGMCATAIEEELTEGYRSRDRRQFGNSLHRAKMWAMELEFHLRFVVTMGYAPRSAVADYIRDCDEVSHRIERLQEKLGYNKKDWSIDDED
ncbi:MAG TPA: four helix bundle protein [Gemmatimonadales bacterium]|nr:four helix bundle protein [Gemmatimonadales bacterium]